MPGRRHTLPVMLVKDLWHALSARPVREGDYAGWRRLYQGYAQFYRVQQAGAMAERVWAWLSDSAHEVQGLVVTDQQDELIGVAHYRAFARTHCHGE